PRSDDQISGRAHRRQGLTLALAIQTPSMAKKVLGSVLKSALAEASREAIHVGFAGGSPYLVPAILHPQSCAAAHACICLVLMARSIRWRRGSARLHR